MDQVQTVHCGSLLSLLSISLPGSLVEALDLACVSTMWNKVTGILTCKHLPLLCTCNICKVYNKIEPYGNQLQHAIVLYVHRTYFSIKVNKDNCAASYFSVALIISKNCTCNNM
jgi:hypothetical protein